MRALRTRWFRLRFRQRSWRWRVGLIRDEWWIGARYDFASDAVMVGILGAMLVVVRT